VFGSFVLTRQFPFSQFLFYLQKYMFFKSLSFIQSVSNEMNGSDGGLFCIYIHACNT